MSAPKQALGWKRVRPGRVSEQVFEQLARAIMGGEWSPGVALPSERVLAQEFDVSRLLVRQAIHRLGDLGLVTVRQGGATVVSDPDTCDHPEVGVLALRFSPDSAGQRRALRERQIAGGLSMLLLAARRFGPDDAEALRRCVAAYRVDPEGGGDQDFWAHIAGMTNNPFFRRETRYWHRVISETAPLRDRLHLSHDVRVAGYSRLVDCLESGEGVLDAYAKMANHLLDRLE